MLNSSKLNFLFISLISLKKILDGWFIGGIHISPTTSKLRALQ